MKTLPENQAIKTKVLPSILIVDDNPANVLLLVKMLNARGCYRPRSVLTGKLALEAARSAPPDLILLDINMPEMNGYEVCRQLKADTELKDIPVIFISALDGTFDKVKAFSVGGVDYVTKPFQCEEVYARILTHLKLRRLEKLRDDLIHMAVHDLRSPLSVILGFIYILESDEGKNLSVSTQEVVTAAHQSADNMLNMISSILDISKMEAGKMILQRESCDLVALVRSVLDTNQHLLCKLTMTLDMPVSSMVMADIVLIRRVFQNLLGNALKYSKENSNIHVFIATSDDETCIAVTDAGPGIAPEYHKRVFEKFGQVNDEKSRLGSGLGLTFCKMAVEAHGGRIGVESEPGKGSTFWFALPLKNDNIV